MSEPEKIFLPSKFIKEALAKRGLTQTDFAVIVGRYPSTISNYIAKETISIEFAKELELVLGETAEYWLGLENKFRLSQIGDLDDSIKRRNSFVQDYPLKDMQKRGWISKTDDFNRLEKELNAFFESNLTDRSLEAATTFKRTLKQEDLNSAEKAWLYRAEHLANILQVGPYKETQFDALLRLLKKAVKSSKAVHKITDVLHRFGVRFVIIEPLPRAKIDGAAFWLDENSPVVALSLRFDNIGSFWFALMHELMHVKYRDFWGAFAVDNFENGESNDVEDRANREAAEFLVPQDRLNGFIDAHGPYYSRELINDFATQLEVHPGIIVGQLQHKKEIGFDKHHSLMAKVRELATMTAFTDGWGHPVPQVKFNIEEG